MAIRKERPAKMPSLKVDYPRLAKSLSRIVSRENVHYKDAVCTAYASYMGTPKLVVLPRSMEEMNRLMEVCAGERVPVDTIWSKQLEKDALLIEGVVIDTRVLARSNPPSVVWDYTHYGEPLIIYRRWWAR